VFRFPQEGGTGAIWKKVAAMLPADKQRYSTSVQSIDAAAKVLTLSDGSQVQYNKVSWESAAAQIALRPSLFALC
jgi:protoporphyrinogen oxidase